jgi:DNA-binding CsgD family transcriptional regulator
LKTRGARDRAPAAEGTASWPPEPPGLTAHRFRVRDDEFVLLSFTPPHGAEPEPSSSLTAAERAVLALVLEGLSTGAIARARGTSPRTIGHQLAAIYHKFGVHSRRELRATASQQPGGTR